MALLVVSSYLVACEESYAVRGSGPVGMVIAIPPCMMSAAQ